MSNQNNKSGAGKFALGALLGIAAGAIVGLLTAPKSGKETRADLANKANELKDAATQKATDVKQAAQDGFDATADIATKHAGNISDFAKDEARELKDDIANLRKNTQK